MGIFNFLLPKEEKKKISRHRTVLKDGVEYRYQKNRLSKSIKITVKGRYNVSVTLPFNCKYETAENFVSSKQNWIKNQLEIFDFNLIDENFKTKTGNLIITSGLTQKTSIKKTGDIIQFIYPIGADFYSKEIQNELKKALKRALYLEAKEYLPKRLEELSNKFNFKFNKLALKTHKTRWGSCSYNNNINLNINLMMLEEKYIDYVLIHELCHTVEKNHGERFWALLENCMPDARKISKELKKKRSVI